MSGIKIGRYEVTSELGRGGMGIVYKAVDPMLERELAIKILPPKKLSKDLIERFLREARAVAKLDSPYIVKIFDIGEQPDGDNRIYYIVMEFVRGKTLGEHFSEGPPGNFDELWDRLEIFDQVLEAIDYAHEQGVIHRDLKPDNLMVTPNERVKIMDFGLAFFAGSHSLTRADQIMGTVAYFSPEQAKAAKDIDHRADIYSLGVILFELLTGELPFQAEHPLDMMQKLLTEPPRRPRSLNPIVTAELEEICLKCLEKQPAVRYHKVADLRRDLQAVKAPPQAPRGARPSTGRASVLASAQRGDPASGRFGGNEAVLCGPNPLHPASLQPTGGASCGAARGSSGGGRRPGRLCAGGGSSAGGLSSSSRRRALDRRTSRRPSGFGDAGDGLRWSPGGSRPPLPGYAAGGAVAAPVAGLHLLADVDAGRTSRGGACRAGQA
jgi:serine/threonine protein kinase